MERLKAAGIPDLGPAPLGEDFAGSHLIIWNKEAAAKYWAGQEVSANA